MFPRRNKQKGRFFDQSNFVSDEWVLRNMCALKQCSVQHILLLSSKWNDPSVNVEGQCSTEIAFHLNKKLHCSWRSGFKRKTEAVVDVFFVLFGLFPVTNRQMFETLAILAIWNSSLPYSHVYIISFLLFPAPSYVCLCKRQASASYAQNLVIARNNIRACLQNRLFGPYRPIDERKVSSMCWLLWAALGWAVAIN